MKFLKSILFLSLLVLASQGFSQEVFTVYDRSPESAKQAWDVEFGGGHAPSVETFLNANNTYSQSLGYLMLALNDSDPDSVIAHVVKSVFVAGEFLDTIRYKLPLKVQERLSQNLPGGRQHLLDGMMKLYYLSPWQCEGILQEKEDLCRKDKAMPMLAIALLNRALLFTEVLNKPERALPLLDSAIVLWKNLGDMAQMANNIKARGLVYCGLQKYQPAATEIKTAMGIFRTNHEEYGVLSCQLDLVKVYALSGESDSMKHYDALCRESFEGGDTIRLFVLNTHRISAFQMANQYSIRDFIIQNHHLLGLADIHPAMIIEYYKTALKALRFFGETAMLKTYTAEYELLKTKYLQQGYWEGLF